MRAEGKAFCSDSWYLLAGVLLQKRRTSLPSKRKASTQTDSHTSGVSASSNGGSALASTLDLLNGASDGHTSNGHSSNGHSSNGHSSHTYSGNGHSGIGHSANGHSADGHSAHGHSAGSETQRPQQDGVGDCSGLRHRYSTNTDGAVNAAEDQLDELIQVMTALR